VNKFLADIASYGHSDFEPKLVGRGTNVMVTPLPRTKRAKNPRLVEDGHALPAAPAPANNSPASPPRRPSEQKPGGFVNRPFAKLEVK
jgi:hypothetical protein